MAYTKYSLTPANNNAAPPDGAPEGMLPSAVNDTMRDMMAQIRDVGDGVRGGTYTMTAPVITGGSINNTTIGASTRSTGAFTTLASNGATTFTAGTASTSTTTGTAVITGGLGVSGRINAANFDGIVGANTAAAGNFTTLGATGVATFSAGTVSAPAITTTGDTNTGIFFPAADTIAFAEGGVEAMRINSSANVGIGTTAPADKLQVVGAIFASDGGTQGIRLGSTGEMEIAKTAGDAYIDFKTSTAEDYDCRIQQLSNGLRFVTGGDGAATEKMRVTSAGRVGVGTSAPSSTLFLSATGTEVPFQFAANTNGASYPASILGGSVDSNFSGGSGEFGIWNTFTGAATSFVLRQLTGASSASNLMVIKPNGYLALGGVDPSSFITIAGGTLSSTAATTIPYFNTTFSTGNGVNLQRSAIRTSAGSDWQTSGYREQVIVDSTFQGWMQYNGTTGGVPCIAWGAGAAGTALGVTESMRLTSTGLGIGTTTPAQKLQIGVTGTNNYIQFGTTNEGFVIGRENSTGDFLFNATQASPYNVFKWQQGGTERMRIDSSGNVLVGTTTTAGSVSNTANVVGGLFTTHSGTSGTIATGTPTNIITSLVTGGYYLVAVNGASNSTIYSMAYVYFDGGGTGNVTTIASVALTITSGSANAITLTTAGAGQAFSWSITRIK
jgi:hypothetical protein